MSARLTAGPAGRVASRLAEHLAAEARRSPWRRHTVIVPGARAAEVLALRVAEAGGAFGLSLLALPALARRLLMPEPPEPLGRAAALLLMRQAAREAGLEAGQGARALLAVRRLLAELGVEPAQLADALPSAQQRALERFDLLRRPRPLEPEVVWAAARRLEAGEASPPDHLDMWGFLALTPAEAALVAALAAHADVAAYLSAPAPGGGAGAGRARLLAALGAAEAAVAADELAPVQLLPAANPAAEADAAARLLAGWAADDLTPHRLAAVGPRPSLERVAERLEHLGLAVRLVPGPLRARPPGTLLTRLVKVWAEDRPDDLAALLAGPWAPAEAAGAAALARRVEGMGGTSARGRLRAVWRREEEGEGEGDGAGEAAILLLHHLERLDAARTWGERAQVLADALDDLGADAGPDPDAQAVHAALLRLAALDALPARLAEPADVADALGEELSHTAPPPRLEAAPVELLTWEEAGALAADGVVLLGVAAEDVGAPQAAGEVLPEEARRKLAHLGREADGPDETPQRRLAAAAVARAGAGRVGAAYVAQGRTGERPPAALLAPYRVAAMPDLPLDALDSRARLFARARAGEEALVALAAGAAPPAGAARWLMAARFPGATEYDGQVPPPRWRESPGGWSPTVLEGYATCPYTDFAGRILGLDGGRPPGALDDVEAAPDVAGRLAHAALEALRRRARSEGQEPLTAAHLGWARDVLAEALEQAFAQEAQGPLGPVQRQVLLADLAHAVALDVRLGDLETWDTEWRFGPDGAASLVLTGEDGERYPVRGRVDRLAAAPGGELWVIDYKAGRSLPRAAVAPDALQLPLYMLAVAEAFHRDLRRMRGAYVSVSAGGGFVRRVLDGAELERELPALRAAVAAAVAGMRAGDFRPRPDGGRNCRFCRFRPLCPPDVAERAARKGWDETGDGTAPGKEEEP
ncbi:MAG: PD-(D/E)XK nuclease family protein [Firmicutes bacterium]|nr:PD-(D/E)XK nuclease family protein [Bacillota bacterium]